ncbi:hypothetical protein GQX74_011296 [Glossina fuscipes]|nr:hypothetical protein GQX74_011296 [Glossina fuscipes]
MEASTNSYKYKAESEFGFGFAQAACGVNKDVNVNIVDVQNAKAQNASLARNHAAVNIGTGMETISTGPFVMRYTCRYCQGTRQYTVQRKKVTVPVPAGIEDGQTVRMQVGKKELFGTFRVELSRHLKRKGADVHSSATISLGQAVIGGTILLRGKDLKRVNAHGHGDHYVTVKIEMPKHRNKEQRQLLIKYAELETNTPGSIDVIT